MSPLHSGVPVEGRSLPNLQSCEACSCCVFCMILVQHNTLPLALPPTSLQSHESLVEAVGSSHFSTTALGCCTGSAETCGVLYIDGSVFH